ncbi:MAG: hypothetical protein IKK58_05005 [Clostridia bacterium]|nr:hypothetical protein [Clostridia bacterium]
MKQAVIDIGTNSTRLCLAEVTADKSLANITKFLTTTRLGEGSADGFLQPTPMERTANAVVSYHRQAEQCGAEKIYVYATAAVREAQNKHDFAQLLQNNGIKLDILSGEQEAEIAYLGAVQGPDSAVIDIGGGSTEVMLKQNGKVCALSQRLGAVRLFERFDGRNGISTSLLSEVRNYISPTVEQYSAIHPESAKSLVGVSGTATTLAAMFLQLDKYSGQKVQNTRLTIDNVRALMTDLFLPIDKRLLIPGVPENRGDIIPFGCIILEAIMTRYGFDSLRVSDTDSLEGYLMLKNT